MQLRLHFNRRGKGEKSPYNMKTNPTNRKDVTPKNTKNKTKNNSFGKRFGVSVLGGVLGGVLVLGGYGLVISDSTSPITNSPKVENVKPVEEGKTKVSNVNVNVENDTTKAVEKVQGAVVSVTTLQKTQAQLSELERIFGPADGSTEQDGELQEAGEGSGVIYRKDNGKAYIATNNHVVAGADAVQIMLNDGNTAEAKIIGTDVYSDLAVLEIPDEGVTTVAEFGNSNNIKVGEPVLAIGSPLGSVFANSVSKGIISAKDRMITNQTDDGQLINIKAIQTDAAINPGNSGGALVNTEGQVIGINSSKIAQATTGVSAEGMGFAIPSNEVVNIINQLEQGKSIVRPMLGVRMVNLNVVSPEDQQNVLKLNDVDINGGVVVASVEKGSPAEKAGLKQYDVITKLDGEEINGTSELQSILYSKKIGDNLEVTYFRNGKQEKTTVKLDQDSSKLMENQQKEEQQPQIKDNSNPFN